MEDKYLYVYIYLFIFQIKILKLKDLINKWIELNDVKGCILKKISSNKTLKVHHFKWYSLLETMQLLSIRAKEYVFQHREVKMKKKNCP